MIPMLKDILNKKTAYRGQAIIDPDTAAICLASENIRKRSKGHSKYFCDLIASGQWIENHPSPICFDESMRMVDGQHRMFGIVESKRNVIASVATMITADIQKHIDVVMPRAAYHRVEITGDTKNKKAIEIINQLHFIDNHFDCSKLSPTEIQDVYETYKVPLTNLLDMYGGNERLITRASVLAACVKCIAYDQSEGVVFTRSVLRPEGESQPGRKLRDWLLTKSPTGGGVMVNIELFKRAYHCFNKHMEGEEVQLVKTSDEINAKKRRDNSKQ